MSFDNTIDAEDVIPNCDFENSQTEYTDVSRNLKISKSLKTRPISELCKPNPIDEERLENFRRLVTAEETEDFDNTFYNASDEPFEVAPEATSCDLAHMDPEQKAKLEEEWRTELARTEEEIQTLRQVLSSKVRHATELKRKLGITVWKEFREDLGQGVKSIQESTALKDASHKIMEWNNAIQSAPIYQKTTEVVKAAGERTTSVFGSLGGSVARKLGEVKNSNAFKSFEERVVSATGSLKDRMTGPRSNSTNSFEDALNSVERRTSASATTPTIPEEKPAS